MASRMHEQVGHLREDHVAELTLQDTTENNHFEIGLRLGACAQLRHENYQQENEVTGILTRSSLLISSTASSRWFS